MTERQSQSQDPEPVSRSAAPSSELNHSTNGATSKSFAIKPVEGVGVSDAAWDEYLRLIRKKGFSDQERQLRPDWLSKRYNS